MSPAGFGIVTNYRPNLLNILEERRIFESD